MTLFGITILEPTTTITDFILAAMSFYFGHMLYWHPKKFGKNNSYDKRYSQFWALAFLFLGIGSFLGGVSHGFAHMKGEWALLSRAWPFTVMSIAMASFYLLLTIAMEYFAKYRNYIFILAYFKIMAFLLLMFGYPKKYFGEFQTVSFNLVILDYAPVLLLLLIMNSWEFIKTKIQAAKIMSIGIVVSILGTAIQMSGFGFHEHFNHNDIYHVFQMIAIYMMFKSVTLKKLM